MILLLLRVELFAAFIVFGLSSLLHVLFMLILAMSGFLGCRKKFLVHRVPCYYYALMLIEQRHWQALP